MRIWFAAVGAVFLAVTNVPVWAQTLQSIGGPAETPPANFQGQQYVDSRGCLFMRAGLGGRVTWVPRIDRNRQPICNQVSAAAANARLTQEAGPQVTTIETPVATALIGRPMATVASSMPMGRQLGVQAPVIVPGLVPAAKFMAAPRSAACPSSAPQLQRMALATGGAVLVCTRGDGTGWVSPQGKSLELGTLQTAAFSGNFNRYAAPATAAIPPGYRAAWKDDRLNPLRGQGGASGWSAQDQVWTRNTPAQAITAQSVVVPVTTETRLRASTMSSPPASAIQGAGRYVQVGSFGDPNNAARAKGSLASAGLPVASLGLSKGGRALMTVLAGPFATQSDALAALNVAHDLGYRDAFLR